MNADIVKSISEMAKREHAIISSYSTPFLRVVHQRRAARAKDATLNSSSLFVVSDSSNNRCSSEMDKRNYGDDYTQWFWLWWPANGDEWNDGLWGASSSTATFQPIPLLSIAIWRRGFPILDNSEYGQELQSLMEWRLNYFKGIKWLLLLMLMPSCK